MLNYEKLKWYADKEIDYGAYIELSALIDNLESEIKQKPYMAKEVEKVLIDILQKTPMTDVYFVFLTSALMSLFERPEYIELLVDGVLCSEVFSVQNMDNIWRNIGMFLVKHPECETKEVNDAMNRMQEHIYTHLEKQITVIPRKKEERNRNRIVVLGGFFVHERHAPTHSALERCVMLKEQFGVEVVIVSAKEGALEQNIVPYYRLIKANIIPENENKHTWKYGKNEFEFHQIKNPTNEVSGIQETMDLIAELNPYYVVYVGGESNLIGIVNKFCPVIAISTIFSKLRNFHTSFLMLGRIATEEEKRKYPCEIIETPFSFELRKKENDYTRASLEIPENEFVLAIVGLRLDYDVTDEFLEWMEQTEGTFLLFIGKYKRYKEHMNKYPRIKQHSKYTGVIKDVIGVLECADLYVNPKRLGGGFSVIEAFHAGIPAVSLNYGDVAAAAGAEFCVETYEEMKEVIARYQTDKVFYEEMVEKGKAREAYMTNGGALFKEGIEKMLASPKFF